MEVTTGVSKSKKKSKAQLLEAQAPVSNKKMEEKYEKESKGYHWGSNPGLKG